MSTGRTILTTLLAALAVWCFSSACTGGDLLVYSLGTLVSTLLAAAVNRRATFKDISVWFVAFLIGTAFMFAGGTLANFVYLSGPLVLLLSTGTLAALTGGVVAWYCRQHPQNFTFTARTLPLAVFAFTWLMPVEMAVNTKQKATQLRETANLVQRHGLAAFYKVDADGDGTLTVQEIDSALQGNKSLNPQETEYLSLIRAEIAEVGHVTSSHSSAFDQDDGEGNKIHHLITTHTFGVNRDDLISYPDRLEAKYRNW
ncbi:MAG: hypothetical protein K2W95_15290 [Candidatus Obscuribacterales bacterium]|nr:hypothetical protein [Candidatus Obscuribacterales bacterium]